MEQFIDTLINQGPVGILCASLVYVVITIQRSATAKKRDDDRDEMKTQIALLQNEVNRLKDLDLETKLAQILTDLQWLKDKLNK